MAGITERADRFVTKLFKRATPLDAHTEKHISEARSAGKDFLGKLREKRETTIKSRRGGI